MIIGFHGKMRAGKNAAAKRLNVYSQFPVIEVSFAAKLKESAAAVLGCTVSDLETWKNDPGVEVQVVNMDGREIYSSQTLRAYLQHTGTEGHRDIFGTDFWLDAALPLAGLYHDAVYAVTDVRFQNEADRVRELGGIVVKLIGPDDGTVDGHASETPLDCDYTIDNKTRDDNYAALDAQLVNLLPGWARMKAA